MTVADLGSAAGASRPDNARLADHDPRREVSFNQRHAWLREYEDAARERTSATAAAATPPAESRPTQVLTQVAKPAARIPLASPALASWTPSPHAVPPTAGMQSPPVATALHGALADSAGAPHAMPALVPLSPPAAPVMPRGIVAHESAPPATSSRSALPSPAAAPAASTTIAPQAITVHQDATRLSVAVRDASLDRTALPRLLHELNANGSTRGKPHVVVTVNGQRIEQHTEPPQE